MRFITIAMISALALGSTPALAWNSRGHMAVAAVAWDHLTPAAKARATALLKLNPYYSTWIQGVATADQDRVAFLKAATWSDDIKRDHTYIDDSYKPTDPASADITDYNDHKMHKGWHFIDYGFSPDGTPLEAPFPTNAVTQIAKAEDVIASTAATDSAKSYSLSWLLHLVGDIHQPLHATSRFTQALPHGDTGGNAIKACPATTDTCGPRDNLHGFWDDLVGDDLRPETLTPLLAHMPKASADELAVTAPNDWAEESFSIAQKSVYVSPVGTGTGPYHLTQAYRDNARAIAEQRIELAGERLAILINTKLK